MTPDQFDRLDVETQNRMMAYEQAIHAMEAVEATERERDINE